MDGKQAELNTTSKAIGELIRTNRKEEAEAARNKTFLLKDEIKELGIQLSDTESRLEKILVVLAQSATCLGSSRKVSRG